MDVGSTKSRLKPLRFWGWGYADEHLSANEEQLVRTMAGHLVPSGAKELSAPQLTDFELRKPRIKPAPALESCLSSSPYDRLVHSYGKSYADMARMFLCDVPNVPDLVAFPESEQAVTDLLDWASDNAIAVVPFGGGTSVCGGVEADVGDHYQASLSLDLQNLNQIVEIDHRSRAARIQGGAFGPEIEAALRPHSLTLRHFPQSFQFSTLGGWIATRSGGHYATLHTHIDDFVQSTRSVTPQGVLETRRLPGSGAGPSADRMMLGSEGILGLITEAWMRLQDRPVHKASASVHFKDYKQAVEAVRALSQSGLNPSNCRLLDPAEAFLNRLGNGATSILVLAFESADHPLDAWMARALELVSDYGGEVEAPKKEISTDSAAEWKNAFLRMPYYRNLLTPLGVIADTFETAVTWDQFDSLYEGIKTSVGAAIKDVTGQEPMISCRFTHVYPDGPAPYFSFFALGTDNGDLKSALQKWREIKVAANKAVTDCGGTVTHHHAVGRDHREGYEQQSASLYRQSLAASKHALDPTGILNPGVLIDPQNIAVGQGGVLRLNS
ncbi:MAG: FAD-binding oxidoreductase [Pseudomonadota bacterium]